MLPALEREKTLRQQRGEWSQFSPTAFDYLSQRALSISPEVIAAFNRLDKSEYLRPAFAWLDERFNLDKEKAADIAYAGATGFPAVIWSDGEETVNTTSTMDMGVMVDVALVEPERRRRVLVAGSGIGYVPAVLAQELGYKGVFGVEIRKDLALISTRTLKKTRNSRSDYCSW